MAEGGSSEGASRVVCAPVISSPSALDGLSLNFNHLFLSISHISIYLPLHHKMFAPGQEQLSKEEIKAGEIEACQTVKMTVLGGIALYLSPFAIDFARKFL
ncbi:hypothetical protein PENSTE_c007G02260 [Penicillium steckii]|uniref:Mitochondrial outer membrane translocase complex, subunit Tom5 n=1 Tax=Penicillium steckii TaxID=303698 RepID=A0A1V6TD67_9EURO|nr:hypothetical protein PENSTE_c007G02260 [Penicillium steckii]